MARVEERAVDGSAKRRSGAAAKVRQWGGECCKERMSAQTRPRMNQPRRNAREVDELVELTAEC